MLRKGAWGVMAVSAVLIAAYAFAGAFVAGLRPPFMEDLFAQKALRTLGHLAAGGTALGVGAFQFSTGLRVRRPKTHRVLGRVYLVAVLASSVAALLMAPSSSGGLAGHYGFGLLAALWLVTSVAAFASVRSGDYPAHREWMIRSYALCLAAVTLRLYLPLSAVAGIPFEDAYPAISWLCWVPNLVIAEWFFVRGSFASLEATS